MKKDLLAKKNTLARLEREEKQKKEERRKKKGLRVRVIEPAKKEKKGGGTPCHLRGKFFN
ncbi:MAG: hypothetical protein ABIC82_05645 [bacterium]